MKKLIFLTVSIVLLFSCEKDEEGYPAPKQLDATDGFAVGCIHIDFEMDPGVDNVLLERREKGTEAWQMITSTSLSSFDDNSGYPNTGIPPGKVFEYRVKNGWPEDAEYSEIEEGYAYDIIPVTEVEITSNINWDDRTINTLTWNESNNGSFINESEIYFDIYRSEDSLGVYDKVGQVGEDRSFVDELPASMLGTKVYYRIDVYYWFELNLPSGGNHSESTTPVEGTIHGVAPSQGDNPTIAYTATDLGEITQASEGGIPRIYEKNIDGTIYLGLINDAGATGIGIPELYRLDGTNWQKEWTTHPINEFGEINYAIASGSHYVAGVQDSMCVYAWDGADWSENLAPDNLGQADSPSQLSIEVDNDHLYMAITQYPEYALQVLGYNGTTWDTIGGDENGIIASGNIYEINIEKTGNILYLHYFIDNTLHIQHLEGNTWVTDISWSNDKMTKIDLALSSSDLYFMSGSTHSTYRGGVYKVTSASTAEEIISNATDEWFQFPQSLTIDSEDHLVLASMYFDESTTSFYPYLSVYDGTEWKTISGDFSDGIDPACVSATGTELIYVYGDAASENPIGDPTIIRSQKFSK